jgi:diguanylate cyclase (GGDEF)-like protein/PAS domain S-box-containing protein
MRTDAAAPEIETARLIARLRAIHLGILLLIALLAVFGQWMTMRALDRNREGAQIVDLAHHIAVQSQTLVSYVQAMADEATSPWARQDLQAKLRQGIHDWDIDSASLSRQLATGRETLRLRSALDASDMLRAKLGQQFRAQLKLSPDDPEAIQLARRSVKQEEAYLQQFLPVASALQEMSAQRDRTVRISIWISLVVILVSLAVEGMIIFRPMVARVAAAIEAQRALEHSESLLRSEERLRAAIEGSFDAFFLMDAVSNQRGVTSDFVVSEANSIAGDLFGVTREALTGASFQDIFPPALAPALLKQFAHCMADRAPFRMEIEVGTPPTRVNWLELHAAPVPGGVAVTARDLTEHKRSEQSLRAEHFELRAANAQLSHLAATDALTGLYNRRALIAMLSEEAHEARQNGTPVGVIMADLDNFKKLNDRFGHVAGDQVLKSVSEMIRLCLRSHDFAARYGGEEFAIVLHETDAEGGVAIAERIRHSIANATIAHGPVTISLGVASWTPANPSGDDLIRAADKALYEAKAAGRNVVRLAQPAQELLTRRES